MTELLLCRVTPFGDPGITGCLLLPQVFRSLPRPSSPDSSKASSVDPYSLDHISLCSFFCGHCCRFRQHLPRHRSQIRSRQSRCSLVACTSRESTSRFRIVLFATIPKLPFLIQVLPISPYRYVPVHYVKRSWHRFFNRAAHHFTTTRYFTWR